MPSALTAVTDEVDLAVTSWPWCRSFLTPGGALGCLRAAAVAHAARRSRLRGLAV